MLRMNCLYWPKSPLRTTPILITYSLCGCTAESRFSPLILSAVVLRRAYLSKCSHHQAPPHAPHAPPHTAHAPPHAPHAPPHAPHAPPHAPHAPPHAPHAPPHVPPHVPHTPPRAPLSQCLPPWFSLRLYACTAVLPPSLMLPTFLLTLSPVIRSRVLLLAPHYSLFTTLAITTPLSRLYC